MLDLPSAHPQLLRAIEQLDYRVTIGDVAAQAGMNPLDVEQGLLALATQTQGNLQVTEQGEIIYVFPKNCRSILSEKFWQLQVREWLGRSWKVIFYGIRLGFGLITLLVVIATAIVSIVVIVGFRVQVSQNHQQDDSSSDSANDNQWNPYSDRSYDRQSTNIHLDWNPLSFFSPIFAWDFDRPRRRGNFLETIYSFVFGDGNPNYNLEERRWKAIAQVIRQQGGAVVAEQVTPFLDALGTGYDRDYESYMLPVLTRFNGSPEVSPQGQLVYRFPDLQKTVVDASTNAQTTKTQTTKTQTTKTPFLEEHRWKFSHANSTGLYMAGVLGIILLVLSLWLLGLTPGAPQLSQQIRIFGRVTGIYSLLYLGVPMVRGWVLLNRNEQISSRNHKRKMLAHQLTEPDQTLQEKIAYAQQFAQHDRLDDQPLLYTTERDLLEQDVEQRDRLDAEWAQRLRQSQQKSQQE
ncbi:MAG: hypothetical protein VKJ24_08550 [Synechococcales bacterium]|nr:hypothetical protein [Synechococcales bacterium]